MLKPHRLACAALAIGCAAPCAAGPHGWDQASSIGRDIMVAAALGVPAVQGDWQGDLQAGSSMLLGAGVAFGLKEAFPEERPDHSDRKSFPSGHSATAFAAGPTLENRYGWQVGLPAFALASFVATPARVERASTIGYDVVAGAGIGTGSGFLLTASSGRWRPPGPWGRHARRRRRDQRTLLAFDPLARMTATGPHPTSQQRTMSGRSGVGAGAEPGQKGSVKRTSHAPLAARARSDRQPPVAIGIAVAAFEPDPGGARRRPPAPAASRNPVERPAPPPASRPRALSHSPNPERSLTCK